MDFDNLHLAYLKARRGKRYSADCLAFSAGLEENLLALRWELLNFTYRTGEYRRFMVYEPKAREIAALPFRDRVVHHALCNVIEPIFETRFYDHSYACRVGKGTHQGVDYLQTALRWMGAGGQPVWVLKGDVRKYFPGVRHDILFELLARHIGCEQTLWLIRGIVDSAGEMDNTLGMKRGIPIGNLTSQFFANVYLTPLDRFIKQVLGARWYVRYMDDWCIVGQEKGQLQAWKRIIGEFLGRELDMELHPKTQVFPMAQGVNFLGYRVWPTHRLLRRVSVKRMRRKLKIFARHSIRLTQVSATVQSWLGHAKHASTYRLRRRLFEEFVLCLRKDDA